MTLQATSAKAAVLRNVGGPFNMEEISVAAPRQDEVRVKIVGVGVCHTDMVVRDGFPMPMPVVLGHEGAGIVEAVGPDVKKVRVGDRVVLSFNSCGTCYSCKHEHPATCAQFLAHNFAGVRLSDGSTPLSQNGQPIHGVFFGQSSFASYAIAREINTVVVKADDPLEILGPLGCGIQTGAGAAINSLAIRPGQSLAIFGGGAVGLSALLGAKAVDAGQVFVVEPNAQRRALAIELGAAKAFDPKDGSDIAEAIKAASGGGVHHAIDTTGISAVIGVAFNSVLPGGRLGLVGIPAPDAPVPVNLMDLLAKGVTLQPITEGDADPQIFIPQMLEYHRKGKFPFEKLVTKFTFDQINEAMHASETGAAIKPVLVL